jgi:putative transposase
MPRRLRFAIDGLIFHVINRGSRKGLLFDTSSDYTAFEAILCEATRRFGIALFAYCLMPNHWHLVITAPSTDALSRFMHWLTTTHACRWHVARGTIGQGAVYQGRYRAMPVAADQHFLWVCRYVERNACRASLVSRAEAWPWSSLWQRQHHPDAVWLSPWPVPAPATWLDWVNSPQTASELHAIRRATFRSEPFGDDAWRAMVLGTPDPLTDL